MPADLTEHLMSINTIQRPVVLHNKDAAYILLARLALLEPGTNQAFPEMGLGLISKYRYSMSDKLSVLEADFKDQISRYLPELDLVEVKADLNNKSLVLKVNIGNEILYPIAINTETMTLADFGTK